MREKAYKKLASPAGCAINLPFLENLSLREAWSAMSLQVSAGDGWLDVPMSAPPKTLADLSHGGRFELVHEETLPSFAVLKRASMDTQRLLFRVKGEEATVPMYAFVNEVPDLKFDQLATVELVLHPV